MKSQQYSLDEIFKKNLLFLIPFYIFSYERRFQEYNQDKAKLELLKQEYLGIRNELEELTVQKIIDEYTKCTIIDMSGKVLENIAKKYENIRKGVKAVMGGKVFEYEAKTIRDQGRREGRRERMTVGNIDGSCQ
ncbi:MAG TPA: hypothetical protein DF613_13660 [Lachnospiraceae bacterium]|nr:hypothetical protein [Lachnospiraceae bacterium]